MRSRLRITAASLGICPRLRLVALAVAVVLPVAACGVDRGPASPQGASPVGTLEALPTPVAASTPSASSNALPSATGTTSTPGAEAAATITLGAFGNADGPGGSVTEALANAGVGPQLVNGILLRGVDGTVWLCEALPTSSPPVCAEPRLLVVNWAQEDQTFVNGEGLHEMDGVRWVEHAQLYGVVRP
jgi:hypothetical protein